AVLVDINRLEELKTLGAAPGVVQMGAGVCQRTIEDNTALPRSLPLIPAALKWVGHVQTRNRGTVGGSLVHADPSAELPLAAAMLDASLHLRSSKDTRVVPASEFFMGPMFTAVGENECLTQIDWPLWN